MNKEFLNDIAIFQLSADSKQILDQPIYKEKNIWLSYIHETK